MTTSISILSATPNSPTLISLSKWHLKLLLYVRKKIHHFMSRNG